MRSIFPADRWAREKENESKGEYWRDGERGQTEKVINSRERVQKVTDEG